MKLIIFSSTLLILGAAIAFASPDISSTPGNISQHGRTSFNMELDPAASAKLQQTETAIQTFDKDGTAALSLHNFADAEQDFQSALGLEHNGPAYLGLAEALLGQGKTVDALQAYHMVFHPGARESWGGSYMPKAHLEYALLLNQSGEWVEAVIHYNASLANLPRGVLPPLISFDPAMPQPAVLAAAAHVGLGLYDNFEYKPDSNVKAFQEYSAALRLAPNSDLANYYYGYGWQRLDLNSPARAANAGQAKAAMIKAAASDDAAVKKAASEALKRMP